MMNSGNSSNDWEIDLDSVNLESWFQDIEAESLMKSGCSGSNDWEIDLDNVNLESWFQDIEAEFLNSGVDATTRNPNTPSQPFTPTIDGGKDLVGASSNTSQSMMTVTNLTPSSSPIPAMQNEGILSSAVKYLSNISAQSSQTDLQFHIVNPAQERQYQPSLQQLFKGKDVQQSTTHSIADQSNMTSGYQTNQNYYQMPSNQLLPYTGPMVNTQTRNHQQPIGSLCRLISGGGWQQGNFNNLNLSAPSGFAKADEFPSINEYHEYILRQIWTLKNRYSKELLKLHYEATKLQTQATNTEESNRCKSVISDSEWMITFLDISRAELLPNDYQTIDNKLNAIVNFMSLHMNKPSEEPRGQPLGAMMMQNNSSGNPYQSVTNLEASMSNFDQNFPSKRPHPQSIMSNVLSTTQQKMLGPKTSSAIESGCPLSLFSNTTATHFPSRPLNPPKKKTPTNKTNDRTKPKGPRGRGVSPLSSELVNRCPIPSTVIPFPKKTSASSSKFDVNSVSSLHSIARSPISLTSNSLTPSKPPMDPPSQEPDTSKDQAVHLTEMIKSVSSNALISSTTDISSTKMATDIIPAGVSQGQCACSTRTSKNKRAKIKKNCARLEEIKEINEPKATSDIHECGHGHFQR